MGYTGASLAFALLSIWILKRCWYLLYQLNIRRYAVSRIADSLCYDTLGDMNFEKMLIFLVPVKYQKVCCQGNCWLILGHANMCRLACVIMIVADALAPNRRQGISNHYGDSTVIMVSYELYHMIIITSQQFNKICFNEVGRPATHQFVHYCRVCFLMVTMLYGAFISNPLPFSPKLLCSN